MPMSMAYFITTALIVSITQKRKKQSFREETVEDFIKTFKSIVERQQDKEARAIFRSGPHRLSDRYKKFEVDSVKWHSLDPKTRMKHVERFGDKGRL